MADTPPRTTRAALAGARCPAQLTSFCPAPSKHLGKPANGSPDLERRPSSLGLDHGWCVYSKLGRACCRRPLFLTESQRHFTACTLKKRQRCSQHFSGVHIVSLPLGLHVLVSKSIHTHKHVRTYNYAPIRDTSSLKTAPRSLPT